MAALREEARLIAESKLFDSEWYLKRYPDVAKAGEEPILHYLRYGAAEKRDPGPKFSTEQYLDWNADVALAGINPLLHYILSGKSEGRIASIYAYEKSLQLGGYK